MAETQGSEKDNAKNAGLWVRYYENMVEFFANHLTIYEPGVGVIINYSIAGMPLRAIGGYHIPANPTDPDVTAIRRQVEQLISSHFQGKSADPTVGIRKKVLQMKLSGHEFSFLFDADEPLPKELEPIEEAIHRLLARSASHPLSTVSMKLTLSPAPLHVGDPLKVEIDVQSIGRFPLDFVSPATFKADGPGSFRLNFWSPTGDREDPEEFAFTLNLAGRELQVADRKTLSRKVPLQRLEAGTILKLWTTLPLPRCKPGPYMVELVYITPPRMDQVAEDRRIFGELHADGVPVSILQRKK